MHMSAPRGYPVVTQGFTTRRDAAPFTSRIVTPGKSRPAKPVPPPLALTVVGVVTSSVTAGVAIERRL